jgi:tRNA-Thr(GGU) m(6)t(6)A37 methyltransferase TsaA
MGEVESYEVRPIGTVRSSLTRREDAPRQGSEGAPEAWIELRDDFRDGLLGVEPGRELLLLTWLHRSERDVLQVRPHHDPQRTLKGVFVTRSPDRPNPIGLHPVTVLEVDGCRLRVAPLEAIDGTPVLDIKVATRADGRCPEPSR